MAKKTKLNATESLLAEIESKQTKRKLVYHSKKRVTPAKSSSKNSEQVRVLRYGPKAAPRHSIRTLVKIMRNKRNIVARCTNISSTGMFVNTSNEDFNVGEYVKLKFQLNNTSKVQIMIAQIVRLNKNPKYPLGYGIKFISGF